MMENKSINESIRVILEKKKLETDMNDQIVAGTYQTKSFDMSDKAQKLYSSLPKDIDSNSAEQSAIHLDKLLRLDKETNSRNHSSDADINTAKSHVDKIKFLSKKMNLEKEHKDIINRSFDNIFGRKGNIKSVISPDEQKHPSDDPRFNTPEKNYSSDKSNDRDIDNVKNFLINRSIKAQRKLKIIDND